MCFLIVTWLEKEKYGAANGEEGVKVKFDFLGDLLE